MYNRIVDEEFRAFETLHTSKYYKKAGSTHSISVNLECIEGLHRYTSIEY